MEVLVVNSATSRRTRCRKPIDTHPSQYLIIRPGVAVCPIVEFLIDPGKEGDGAVVETVAEGLRFGGLELVIAAAFFVEPVSSGDAGFFEVGVGG